MIVDPTSPFTHGALLGDRLRMNDHFNDPNIYIRSLATRGALGGLSLRTLEVSYVLKASGFDYIFIETVGVGQSEVEIAGLADVTLVVLMPEAGDDIQSMKAGLMEIADIFVVNKSDRPGADILVKNLHQLLAPDQHTKIPVVKTIALQKTGIEKLYDEIKQHRNHHSRRNWLLAARAFHLIQQKRMQNVSKEKLEEMIVEESKKDHFNLYSFIQKFDASQKLR